MIDFSNIKRIVIPEGEVATIARGAEILWKKLKLPPEYQEVEFIESTGTQWIDTGYVMTANDLSFEGEMLWTEASGAANFFFGYRSVQTATAVGDMRAFFIYGAAPVGRLAIRYGKNADNSTAVTKQNTKHKVSFDGSALKVDGVTFATAKEAYNPAKYKSMWLFNCNAVGYYSADITPFKGRIYSFKMWQGASLVRNFVPCYHKSTGEAGMYDLVTDTFYENAGTGEFYCEKPKYKAELDYIESTGTQYIDTGYIPNTNTKVELYTGAITANTFPVTSGGWFVGSRTSYMDRSFGTYYNPGEQSLYGAFGNQQLSVYIPSSAFYGKNHLFAIDKSGLYLNGNKRISFNNSFVGEYPLWLFTINLANSRANLMSFKVYYFKAWESDELVRDLIPVLDWNNTPCMYDKVSDQLFYNVGTGEFLYGEI